MMAPIQWFFDRFVTRRSQKELASLSGNNALHLAVVYDNPERLEKLLSDEDLLSEKNALGFTAYQLAKYLNRKTCQRILRPDVPEPMIAFQPQGALEPSRFLAEDFKHLTGIEYISYPQFLDFHTLCQASVQSGQADRDRYLDPESRFAGAFFRNQVQRGDAPDVTIKWISRDIGYGVFTNQHIADGAYAGEYCGLVRPRKLWAFYFSDYCFRYPTARWYKPAYTIDSEKAGNFTRYINHSDTPNLESLSILAGPLMHIVFRAIKDIPPGTQLTFDYGPQYWQHRWGKRSDPGD